MREVMLLLLSLMFAYPSVSAIQLVYYSCDQTWMSQVPNAPLDASFAFSSDGAHMAIGELELPAGLRGSPNATNNLIYITPGLPQILFAPLGPPLGPWRIWMSADGNVIATALNDGGVQLFSQATPEYVWKFPASPYNSLAVSGDGRYVPALVQNRTSNTLYLLSARYDNITWSYRFAPLAENSTGFQPIAVSYDGGRIAALLGRSVFVFSNTSNQTLWSKTIEGPQTGPYGILTSVYLSQDGNFLTTIDGANVTVYSASTGSLEKSMILSRNWGLSGNTLDGLFAMSQDGSTMAIVDAGELSVFDRASGVELFSKTVMDQIQVGSGQPPSPETPYTVSISQDGTVIAVGSWQHAVFIFDRSGNELCRTYAGPNITGSGAIVGISADGKSVGAFAQNFAELLAVTPQYYLIILIGVGTPVAIVSGYFVVKRRRKAKQSGQVKPKNIIPRQDPPERVPGPFVDPSKARS